MGLCLYHLMTLEQDLRNIHVAGTQYKSNSLHEALQFSNKQPIAAKECESQLCQGIKT